MNLPAAFRERMEQQLGAAFPTFLDSLQQSPPVSLRLNPAKWSAPASPERVPWAAQGFYLPERPVFTLDPLWHAGAYYVQEASSMFLEQVLRQSVSGDQPLKVLDLCGAPGGKSTHLASLLPEGSLLVANEVIRGRARILAENLTKWGGGHHVVTQNDPRDFQELPGFFDVVVIDAPCSGEGLFRRDADAMQEWSEANVHLCADRQKRILADVWPTLRPGGTLIYSTCTWSPDENEANVAWLAEQVDLDPVSVAIDPAWGMEEIPIGPFTGYRFYPHHTRGEGLFMIAVRKAGYAVRSAVAGRSRTSRHKKSNFLTVGKKEQAALSTWLHAPEAWTLTQEGEQVHALPTAHLADLERLQEHLRWVTGGIALAEIKGKHLNPMPGLALSTHLQTNVFPHVELDHATALRYLHRDEVTVPDAPRGWVRVTFRGVGLGWLKNLGNRTNNYFPKEWRILMSVDDPDAFFTLPV
ncbi:16S rRNA C967 or C1407 C5-methylase, RsmB/RsmF family [Catalinimonas alkaloidigena]|uniref:16S rRNA C967 or C1407 C5-methylase, RsmB/RsmF family n=1 Tax=Catalinimonas alkaloidigena TaxID=1075417 RepID=A0A1G9MTB6_9BACT|nr:rRNA methyltransferase [Catalinimonas alkaloidigena]SDL77480.1 16S rRNA C967 or C1407 C5-methylase, RsmB/RsmF family [Catalinimonas alkaloidigena]